MAVILNNSTQIALTSYLQHLFNHIESISKLLKHFTFFFFLRIKEHSRPGAGYEVWPSGQHPGLSPVAHQTHRICVSMQGFTLSQNKDLVLTHFDVGIRQICKLMFGFLWDKHLKLPVRRLSSRPGLGRASRNHLSRGGLIRWLYRETSYWSTIEEFL